MKKNNTKKIGLIIILSLLVFAFFSPFLRPATEGVTFPDDVAGLKLSSSADFYAISESDYTTRWILQNATLTPVEDFNDDINTDYWELVDVSKISFNKTISESSNYLLDNYTVSTDKNLIGYTGVSFDIDVENNLPYGLTTNGTHILVVDDGTNEVYAYDSDGVYTGWHFDTSGQTTYPKAIAWDGTYYWIPDWFSENVYRYNADGSYSGFSFSVVSEMLNPHGIVYNGTDLWIVNHWNKKAFSYNTTGDYTGNWFSTSTLTYSDGIGWDGTSFWVVDYLDGKVHEYDAIGVKTGIYFDVSAESGHTSDVVCNGTSFWIVDWSDKEVYKYDYGNKIYKNYFGSGYMYIQTNETESIGLQSIDYTTHYNISSGDYFEVDSQTNSDSQINLILLKDGVVNKTLILSGSGNSNFNRHIVQISVDEFVEFDQLKISSTFEDQDYIKVWDIKTYKYEIVGDYADFYLGSKRTHSVNLTSDLYNLRIFDPYDDGVKVNENITIGISDYFYIYTPVETIDCRLTLFNTGKETHLDFEDYHISINRSLNGEWSIFDLLDNIFSADIGSNVYINVSDRFDTLIDSFEKLVASYIDLELEVYSLQIKNLMEQKTTLDINATYVYPLLSGDSIYFMLSKAYYQIGFYDEYNSYKNFTIYLSSNQAYQLNSSLKTIYFSMFTYDGLGIDHDLVRFYINSERKDLGFNSMLEDTLELIILDFFNNTLANVTIDANAYDNSEYNFFVEIYSLVILNQFTYEDIVVNITQVGSGVWMTQIIPKQFGLTYRFLPNVEYNITIYFTNETFYDSRIVNLTSNSHIESFGVATTTPEYPKDVYFGVYTTTGLGIDHDLLRFYIDGNRTDFGFNRIENMIVTVVVKDFFNTTLFNQMINTSGIYEYDILITLYSLKVKNEARVATNYTLSYGVLETTGYILPEEIIEYQLSSNNYVFDYTNNEDGSSGIININLNQDRVYILNSTYYDVYIGLYNFYGVVNREEVKFYINNTRADFGFNTITSEDVNLLVLDFFNSTLYNQTVRLEGLSEYSIFVQAYTLVVNNLYNSQSITIKITRGNITLERLIEAQGWTEFKLFPNIEYEIISYVNGTNDETKEVKLDEEYKTVDFGFFQMDLPETPDPLEADFITLMVFVLIVAVISIIIAISWGKIRPYKRKRVRTLNGEPISYIESVKYRIKKADKYNLFPTVVFCIGIGVLVILVVMALFNLFM